MRLSTPPRLPKLPGPPKAPTGPRFVPPHEEVMGGPGEPPEGFLTGQNSLTEWYVYFALAKIFRDPKDPRKPPYFGGLEWGYQIARLGGFVRALGSAVVDFAVYQDATILGIRVVTERFHIFANSRTQANDAIQRASLEANGLRVVDLYDHQILGDPSGQKAIIHLKQVLQRIEQVNPVLAGTAIRATRLKVLG